MASTPAYALAQLWATLSGTIPQRLVQVNATTVAGPNVDISLSAIAGYLLLQGVYPTLTAFAATSPNNTQPHDGALTAAKTFLSYIAIPNAPSVNMANPTVYAQFATLGSAIVAQETASPGSTGCTQAVLNGLLALAQTTQPWWQANGFSGPVTLADVNAAGLNPPPTS